MLQKGLTQADIDQFYIDLESVGLLKPVAELARISNLSPGNVSEYLSKKKKPSKRLIDAFYEHYKTSIKVPRETFEEKNTDYGKPANVTLVETEDDIKQFSKASTNAKAVGKPTGTYKNKTGNEFIELSDGRYIMTIPLVNAKARAGYLTGWGDEEYLDELPKHSLIVDKPHLGEYLSFEIVGESLNDGTSRSLLPGDIVSGRKIQRHLWKSNKLHLKKYKLFIIVTTKGVLVKEILKHNVDKNTITIHSYNPDKEAYPDEEINLDMVMQILNVVDIHRKP